MKSIGIDIFIKLIYVGQYGCFSCIVSDARRKRNL